MGPHHLASPSNDGPSVKETLDWLKEKIPLGIINHVESWEKLAVPPFSASVSEHAVVISLDSCTCVLDTVSTFTILRRPQVSTPPSIDRFTAHLGTLQRVYVAHVENSDHGDLHTIYVDGERWAYSVYLESKSKDITRETIGHNEFELPNEAMSFFHLKFSDESMANRVAEAFRHAVVLCQKQEAF